MKLKKIILHNFRAYQHEEIEFNDNFACIIGKNDAGKSTILSALEWFFDDNELNEYDRNVNCPAYEDYYVEAIFSEISFPKFDLKIVLDDEETQQDEFSFTSDLGFIQSLEISLRKYSNIEREILITCGGKKINEEPLTFGGATIKRMCQSLYDAYIHDSNKCCIRTNNRIPKDDWWQWDNGGFYWSIFNYFKPNCSLDYYLNILFKQRCYEMSLEKHISSIKTSLSNDIGNELIGIVTKKAMSFNSSINKINFFPNGSDLFFETSDSLLLQIPLTNRGDGFQLQIKNTVCKLLAKNISKSSNERCYIFGFEEPETHLHPKAQLEMYDIIKDLVKNPNYQVIITTHSPYIVKELAKDNIKPIVIKRNEQENKSYKCSLDEKVLPYVSMNEINYIAFDQPSIEYHIELFGFIHNKLMDKYENDSSFKNDWDSSIVALDKNGVLVKVSVSTIKGVDVWLEVKNGARKYNWYETKTFTKEKRTLPYCVRNNIDHPLTEDDSSNINKHRAFVNNAKFEKYIQQSIDIMRNAIINLNKKTL